MARSRSRNSTAKSDRRESNGDDSNSPKESQPESDSPLSFEYEIEDGLKVTLKPGEVELSREYELTENDLIEFSAGIDFSIADVEVKKKGLDLEASGEVSLPGNLLGVSAGIVIDLNNVSSEYKNKFVNQGLVGFRVEYLNSDGTKIPNFFRIVTSSFYCEPVVQNLTNTIQKSIRYRYVEGSTNLLFCTLSPSSSPTNKPSATPFIGQPNQSIILTNTYFNPITTEIEIVDQDISTLAIALYGNQTKSIEDGIYTIYDSDNNIYKQYNLYEIKDQFNSLLYEVRQNRGENIDFSKAFNNITA
jgi:hypothetical protein